ncbi:hypothetical protein [Streptomyces sp. 135]|uniref:hypothetical protein n=1 Tax=Streptomyces sp. 135 TaxID=2838850 RepID=UPI001CBB8C7E|nr:hypothetical protein [Streptomyces sp. 135]
MLRSLEAHRLDRLFSVAYKKAVRDQGLTAVGPDTADHGTHARFLGLDIPFKTEVSGPQGGPVQVENVTTDELDALIDLTDPVTA